MKGRIARNLLIILAPWRLIFWLDEAFDRFCLWAMVEIKVRRLLREKGSIRTAGSCTGFGSIGECRCAATCSRQSRERAVAAIEKAAAR